MSRFVFADLERPKRVAKKLLSLLSDTTPGLTLSNCHSIVADMLGFESWHQMAAVSRSEPPSDYDSQCPELVTGARRRRQLEALQRAGVPAVQAALLADALHVTDVRSAPVIDAPLPLTMNTPWWKAVSHVPMPEGMMRVAATYSSGIAVPKALVAEMPAILRSKPDHTGYAWYETGLEDCLVPIALPRLFAQGEIDKARREADVRYPTLMQALDASKRISSWDLRSIRPHRVERRLQPTAWEFFNIHIKGYTFVGEIHGKEPIITAYRGADWHHSGAGYLGAVSLKYVRHMNRDGEEAATWGVHKYGHDFECNISLEGFDHEDVERLSQAFGINYMSENAVSFYYSDAWKAMREWGDAHPRLVRTGKNGTHIAWVSRLGAPDPEPDEWAADRQKASHSMRDYMISKVMDGTAKLSFSR